MSPRTRVERGERVVVEQQAQAMVVVGRVERDDRASPSPVELRDGPRADAAVRARDEEAFVHGADRSRAQPVLRR